MKSVRKLLSSYKLQSCKKATSPMLQQHDLIGNTIFLCSSNGASVDASDKQL